MRERIRFADLVAIAGYLPVLCLFFWPLLFTHAVLTGYDTVTIFYPHRMSVVRALLDGRLPLWNPDHFLGAPLLANPQVAALYPLNWPFLALSLGQSLSWTLAAHVGLAACGMYAFARRAIGLGRIAAWLSGVTYAFGGFMLQQTGHLNQVSVAAWLPLVLLLGEQAWRRPSPRAVAAFALAIALQFLAGHSQESYMILVALAAYIVFLTAHAYGLRGVRSALRPLAAVVLGVVLGTALAAVQLLPTAELSGLSIRSGGLSFRQASSFSLEPRNLALALLPNYTAAPPSEMAGHIGVIALLLALIGALWHPQRGIARFFALVATVALLLALGRYTPVYWAAYYVLPGVAFFRVPARWLLLYSFAAAALAAMGYDVLLSRRPLAAPPKAQIVAGLTLAVALVIAGGLFLHLPSLTVMTAWAGGCCLVILVVIVQREGLIKLGMLPVVGVALLVLTIAELYAAGRFFEYNRLAPPESITALRPSIAHLQTQDGAPFRILSVSDATWDPGDMAEIAAMLGTKPASQLSDYLDVVKNKELLTANLPSLFGIQTADGYDGGVLPLRAYVDMEGLFLPPDRLSPDGRLRDHLAGIPEARLLAPLNVSYVIADKVNDVWIDNVYYDLAFETSITRELTLTLPQPMIATAIGLVSRLAGGANAALGDVVGEVILSDSNGHHLTCHIIAGKHTATPDETTGLRVVEHRVGGRYVYAVVTLPKALAPTTVTVRYVAGHGQLDLRGLAILDQRTGAGLALPTAADVSLTHSGDVKIYRNLRVLPRTYIVHRARVAETTAEAVSILRQPDFDPAQEAVVAEPVQVDLASQSSADNVRIMSYQTERVVIEARAASRGLLVLADATYPGWQARVDGQPTRILTVNGMFRGVEVTAGDHTVEFTYRPLSLVVGAIVSLGAAMIIMVSLAATSRPR